LFILTAINSLSADVRDHILSHLDNGFNGRKIATIVSVSRFNVQKAHKQYQSNALKAREGCPSKLSSQTKRSFIRAMTSGELDTAVAVNKRLESELNACASDNTVCHTFMEAGLEASAKVEKPMVTKKNAAAQLAFANRHQY
jgi:transposase